MRFEFVDDNDETSIENLWVTTQSDNLYQVHNVPFFVRGIAFLDVVSGVMRDKDLVFVALQEQSGNSTVRVVMFNIDDRKSVCDELNALGCDIEISHLPKLLAVDIPKKADWNVVRKHLDLLTERKTIDYEEASISAEHLHREQP